MLPTIFSGPDDLIVIVVALVVLFGGSQLPKFARNAGEAMREFRKVGGEVKLTQQTLGEPPAPVPTTAPAVPEQDGPAAALGGRAGSSPLVGSSPLAPDEKVTLTRSELDALLAEREARAGAEKPGPPK